MIYAVDDAVHPLVLYRRSTRSTVILYPSRPTAKDADRLLSCVLGIGFEEQVGELLPHPGSNLLGP